MKYFKDESGGAHGFDEEDVAQVALMNELTANWTELPTWPLAPSLDDVKNAQTEIISAACATAINAGFTSKTLGQTYIYPSTPPDQANLNANVVSSLLPGNAKDWTTLQMCCDASGEWAYRPHSAAQIQQVGADGKAAILACLTKKASLQAAIEAAADVAALEAVTW